MNINWYVLLDGLNSQAIRLTDSFAQSCRGIVLGPFPTRDDARTNAEAAKDAMERLRKEASRDGYDLGKQIYESGNGVMLAGAREGGAA